MLTKQGIQALLDRAAQRLMVPSISVSLTIGGEHLHAVTGYADVENKIPASKDTVYHVASCTKAFTALALCKLQEKGKLSLDERVKQYIPEFEMYESYATENATIRDVLTHRTGLPRHDISIYPRYDQLKTEQVVGIIKYLKPFAPIRYKYYYQNHMYILAGYIIERVSGIPWEQYVRENLLDSIGITQAYFHPSEVPDLTVFASPYFANPATRQPFRLPKRLSVFGGAGAIISSTAEMVKWIDLHLNEGAVNGAQIIDSSLIRECHSPQMVISEQSKWPEFDLASYGLGWEIQSYRGRKIVQHGGGADGFSSRHFFVPGYGFGGSILTNGHDTVAPTLLMLELVDKFFCQDDIDWLNRLTPVGAQPDNQTSGPVVPVKREAAELQKYTGTYSHNGYGKVTVRLINDALIAVSNDVSLQVIPVAGGFVAQTPLFPSMTPPVLFEEDPSGIVLSMNIPLEPALDEPICFVRKGE